MAKTKIKAPELNVPAVTMKRIAEKEMQLMEDDALAGKTQSLSGDRTSPYKSESYKKYKQNQMNRFTDRTGGKGTKIEAYRGQSTPYTQTAIKNYHLTGNLYKRISGLHLRNPKVNEVTVSFASKDRGKVLGAREQGDELVGLNNKNINIIKDMIIKKYNKELTKWAKKDINLIIG